MKKLISLLLCGAMCATMLAGCGSSGTTATTAAAGAAAETQAAAAEETKSQELTMWYTFQYENEQPEEEWMINKYARKFEQENPGVKINVVYQEDQEVAMNKLKASVQAGEAPDIAQLYAGYSLSQYEDILADITSLIPAEDKEKILGWETASKDMVVGNPIYGYPASGCELGVFLYNKELVAAAGVDLEGDGKPKNAQEFKAALEKIKATGVTPIIAMSEGLNELWIWGTGAWWPQMSGTGAPLSDSTGKTKFADDAGFIETLDFTATLVSDGLVNEDYSTCEDANTRFYLGEGALYPTGSWSIAEAKEELGDKLGVYCVPSYDGKADPITIGGIGQTWAVLESCENKELAVKWLSYISDKEFTIHLVGVSGNAPKRTDVTAEEVNWAGDPVYESVLEYSKNVILWSDNCLQPDVANDYYTRTGMVCYGQCTAAECAEEFDRIAAEAAK